MRHELGYNPTKSTNQLFAQRLTRLTVALLFCLLILVIRLFYLQMDLSSSNRIIVLKNR